MFDEPIALNCSEDLILHVTYYGTVMFFALSVSSSSKSPVNYAKLHLCERDPC